MKQNILICFSSALLAFMLIGCGGDTASQIQKVQDKNKSIEEGLLDTKQKIIDLEKKITIQNQQISELRKKIQENQRITHNQIKNSQRSTIANRRVLATPQKSNHPNVKRSTQGERHRLYLTNMIGSLVNSRSIKDISNMLNARKIKTLDQQTWTEEAVLKFIRENRIQRRQASTRTAVGTKAAEKK